MESLQRALDALTRELRRGATLREHGFSILFVATGAAAARVLAASFELSSFAGRPIGQAAVENVSVAARTSLYVQAFVLFVLFAAAAALVLPRVAAWLGAGALRALEATSLCGLALFLFAAWRVDTRGMMALLVGAQALVVVPAVLDRVLARTRLAPAVRERGAYAGWIGGSAFALLVPAADFIARPPESLWFLPAAIVVVGLVLDVLRRLACCLPVRSGDAAAVLEARSDTFLRALTPLAALAAATWVRNELYLLASHHGFLSIRPEHVEVAFCGIVMLWCAARALRGPRAVEVRADGRFDLERAIGRFTFPWIVAGTVAMMRFALRHGPSPDFLEPANAGLMIQQWLDFGRIPFIETFGAHGLYDSLFGFAYVVLYGTHDVTWTLFDYLIYVVTALVSFHVLRAWWSSAAAGLFCMLALPRISVLFPDYCAQAAVTIFIVLWVFRRRNAWAWTVFGAWIILVFAWRLDVGFANGVASVATLLLIPLILPEHRLPISAMVRGAIATSALLVLGYWIACRAHGVDAWARFADFLAVIGSNEAFGFAALARDRNEIVLVHTFVVPILVLVACVALVVRMRGRADVRDKVFFAVVGTLWLSAYYFANFPRGLVRHSFLEAPNVVLSSFAFLVLCGSWRWILPPQRRLAAFGAFLVTATLLAWDFDFGATKGRARLAAAAQLDRVAMALRDSPRVAYQRQPAERVEESLWFEEFAQPMVSFLQTELGPGETFLDLSNSPMLYYHARAESPHWLNHVLLVYGERLQRRFLDELQQHDVPYVILPTLQEEAAKMGLQSMSNLDGVPFHLRHYRLFEWVYAHYEPATVVGRWPIWVRQDRLFAQPPPTRRLADIMMPPLDPPEAGRRRLGSLADAKPGDDSTDLGTSFLVDDEIALSLRVPIVLEPDRACAVRILGRSDRGAALHVELFLQDQSVRDDADTGESAGSGARTVSFPAGRRERWLWLPRGPDERRLDRLVLRAHDASVAGGFELEELEVWEFDSPGCRAMDAHIAGGEATEMGRLAYVWGTRDQEQAGPPRVLRELVGMQVDPLRGVVRVAKLDDADWQRGIHRREAAFRLAAGENGVQPGDWLVFAKSGPRRVNGVDGRDVRVDGAPLDPERDGAPRVVRFLEKGAVAGGTVRPRAPRLFPFDPLERPNAGATESFSAYLRLRLRAEEGLGGRLIIGYGAGAQPLGRFVVQLEDDGEAHDYAVRLSAHAAWHRVDCDWIRLLPTHGAVEVLGAAITAGD